MNDTEGPYIVWFDYGYEGWRPYSYKTLREALETSKPYSYIITKKCEYEIIETDTGVL